MLKRSRGLAGVILIAALCVVACRKAPPAGVAATVNGRSITHVRLDKQYEASQLAASDQSAPNNDDQVLISKLQVLRTLIDGEIMLQRAEKQNVMATDSEVDSKFNELKAPLTQEELQKQLAARKMTVDEFKAQLRQDMSIQKLFNKEITANINISDTDISGFYEANKANFNLAEPQVHMAQIVVTPNPDPNVRNLKNDKAQNEQQALQKVKMIEQRLRAGEDFALVAQSYSEDPNTAANGGDLGFIPESSLEKANPELRKLVAGLQPGQMSTIRTQQGFQLLKLVSREPAGQRDLNDPRVRQSIREMLVNRKETLLKEAFYEMARNEADVTNYLATSISQSKGRAPVTK